MTTGRPDPGPNQQTAAVDTNASAQTSSRSPRTCCFQPVQTRTYPNRTERPERLNHPAAANTAEQDRTGPNAGSRHPMLDLGNSRSCSAAQARANSLEKLVSGRKNHHEIAQNCTLHSHDLQQNTGLPQDSPLEEKIRSTPCADNPGPTLSSHCEHRVQPQNSRPR